MTQNNSKRSKQLKITQTGQKLDKMPVNMIQNITEFLTFRDVCASLTRANKSLQHCMEDKAVYHKVTLDQDEDYQIMRWLTSKPVRCSRIRSIRCESLEKSNKQLAELLTHSKTHQGRQPLVMTTSSQFYRRSGESGWMSVDSQMRKVEWLNMKSWIFHDAIDMQSIRQELFLKLNELTLEFYFRTGRNLDTQLLTRYCPNSLQYLNISGFHNDEKTCYALLDNLTNLTALQISFTFTARMTLDEFQQHLPKHLHSLSFIGVKLWKTVPGAGAPVPQNGPNGPSLKPADLGSGGQRDSAAPSSAAPSCALEILSMTDVELESGLSMSQLAHYWPNISKLYLANVDNREGNPTLDLTGWKHLESLTTGFVGERKVVFSPDIHLRVLRSANQGLLDELIPKHHKTLEEFHCTGQNGVDMKWLAVLGNTLKNLSVCDWIVKKEQICSLASMAFASSLEELRFGVLEPMDPSDEHERKIQHEFNQLFEHSFPKLVRLYIPEEYRPRIRRQRPLVSIFSHRF